MKISASDVKNKFGEVLDIVLTDEEDVLIERRGRFVAFMGSAKDHKLFQEFKLERLRRKLAQREAEADRREFTDDSLESIQAEALHEFRVREKV